MSFAAHEILVLSPTSGALLKILSPGQLGELKYSRIVNDIGMFAIVFRGSEQVNEVYPLFTTDTLVEIYRDDQTQDDINLIKEGTYLTRKRERYLDGDGVDTFIVAGPDLNNFLNRRIIDPRDDSVQPNGGYATKVGAADTVMRAYVREQIGDLASPARKIPNLTVPEVAGTGTAIGKRLRHEILLDTVKEIAEGGGVDFYIRRTSSLVFEMVIAAQGTDKTYTTNKFSRRYTVFSPDRGNLLEPHYSIDELQEVTHLMILGPGSGVNRTVIEIFNSSRMNASPYNRIERVNDVRQASVGEALQLLTSGRLELIKSAAKIDFDAKISAHLGGTKYRADWTLGDYITVAWGDQHDDVRISAVEITLSEDGEDIAIQLTQKEDI